MNLEKLSNILGADTIEEIYKDGLSEPTKESSKILVDLIKTLKLFTLPLQYGAMYQDRLTKHLDKVRNNVTVENQIQAPPSVAGPILEKLKYLEEENYLTDLYLNLLSRAIDKERINEAHPAFKNIIDQLSPDEAMLIYQIGKEPILYDHVVDVDIESRETTNKSVDKNTTDLSKITFPEHFKLYIDHLKSLSLIRWKELNQSSYSLDDDRVRYKTYTVIHLTDFGKLFLKACIPEKGFIKFS